MRHQRQHGGQHAHDEKAPARGTRGGRGEPKTRLPPRDRVVPHPAGRSLADLVHATQQACHDSGAGFGARSDQTHTQRGQAQQHDRSDQRPHRHHAQRIAEPLPPQPPGLVCRKFPGLVGVRLQLAAQRQKRIQRRDPGGVHRIRSHRNGYLQRQIRRGGGEQCQHRGGVEGEHAALARAAHHAQHHRHASQKQGRAQRHREAGEDAAATHAAEDARDQAQRQRGHQQRDGEEEPAHQVAQHDLRAAERRGEQHFPCARIALLRDGPGHEQRREQADGRHLRVADPGERARATLRHVLQRAALAKQREHHQQHEQTQRGPAHQQVALATTRTRHQPKHDGIGRQQVAHPAQGGGHVGSL